MTTLSYFALWYRVCTSYFIFSDCSMKKCLFILLFLINNIAVSQEIIKEKSILFGSEESSTVNTNVFNVSESEDTYIIKKFERERIERLEIELFRKKVNDEYSFDFSTAVGSNVSIGGLWGRYAIINFTPQIYIKPIRNVEVYANHTVGCLIPLSGINKYYKSITLQSAALIVIDNSLKIFFPERKWITEAISFAAKVIIVNFVTKPAIKESSNTPSPMYHYENFYYTVRITF